MFTKWVNSVEKKEEQEQESYTVVETLPLPLYFVRPHKERTEWWEKVPKLLLVVATWVILYLFWWGLGY